MELKTTIPTLETRLRTTTGATDISTMRTTLRRMARVHPNDHATICLRFVSKQIPQAVERPLVHSPLLLLATLFRIRADLHQVLNHDQSARSYRLKQVPTGHVVAIRPKPSRPARQLFEMSFGGLCAFGLKCTLQLKVPAFHRFPGTVTEEFVVGCNSGMSDPKVYPDDIPVRNELYVWPGHDHIQPEFALAIDQVGTVICNALFQQTNNIWVQIQRQHLPALNRCQRDAVSKNGVRTLVITNGTVCTLGTPHWFESWNRFPASKSFRNFL